MWPDMYNSLLTAYDLRVSPFILRSNEARAHLLTDIIVQERQEGSIQGLWVNASLAKAARHKAFAWARGANKLQSLLKVGVLPITTNTWKPAHMSALYQVIQSGHFKLLLTLTLLCTVLTNSADVQVTVQLLTIHTSPFCNYCTLINLHT